MSQFAGIVSVRRLDRKPTRARHRYASARSLDHGRTLHAHIRITWAAFFSRTRTLSADHQSVNIGLASSGIDRKDCVRENADGPGLKSRSMNSPCCCRHGAGRRQHRFDKPGNRQRTECPALPRPGTARLCEDGRSELMRIAHITGSATWRSSLIS
jgi:hypothetical protein